MKPVDDRSAVRALVRPLAQRDQDLHARVWAQVEDLPVRRAGRAWLFASAAALLVAGAVLLGLALRSEPVLDRALDSEHGWDAWSPTATLDLTWQGRGQLSGTATAPVVEWRSGSLSLDLEPGTADLRVRTPEAEVQVVGTAFDVTRDALGTAVLVDRGAVRVRCAGQAQVVELGPKDQHLCLPTTASGLLGRSRLLRERGEGRAALEAAAAGLSLEGSEAVRAELHALRVEVYLDQGHSEQALAEARACLDQGCGGREAELRRTAAHLALSLEGCGAVPLLRSLAELEPEEARWLAHCEEAP